MNKNNAFDLIFHKKNNWHFVRILLLFFASSIGLLDINSLPVERHDIYVISTTQGMHQHQDWIVPYYYDQLRLNKPPMNYWITGLTAWLSNSFEHMQPWHGRLISVLSGLGLLSLLLTLAEHLYDRKTAVVASVILLTSMGFYKFTHSARPDMLYAFFCTASYTALFIAFERFKKQQTYWYLSITAWLLFAAAILTKGPHVPAMILISCTFYFMLQKCSFSDILSVLKPVTGIILLAIFSAPWWLLLKQSVGSETMASSQLSGSLLTINWHSILRLYYLYNVWVIIVPWVLLIPYTIYRIIRFDRQESGTQFLSLLIIVAIIIFSFGPQARWFYFLPYLVPICLLLASSLIKLWGVNTHSRGRINFNYSIIVLWLVLVVFLSWLLVTDFKIVPEINPNKIYLLLGLLLITLIISIIFFEYRNKHPYLDLISVLIIFLLIAINTGSTSLFWGKTRFEKYLLAKEIEKKFPETFPLAAFKSNPSVYLFYTERPVKQLRTLSNIKYFLEENGGKAALFISREDIPSLTKGQFKITENCVAVAKVQRYSCVLIELQKYINSPGKLEMDTL